jgi:hypothetical protein
MPFSRLPKNSCRTEGFETCRTIQEICVASDLKKKTKKKKKRLNLMKKHQKKTA